MIALLRYWPYLAILLLAGAVWGMYGHMQSAKKDAARWQTVAEDASRTAAKMKEAAITAETALKARELSLAQTTSALESARKGLRFLKSDCLETKHPPELNEILNR